MAAFVLEGLAEASLPIVPVALLEVELVEVLAEEEGVDATIETVAVTAETEDDAASDVLGAAELPDSVGGGLASAGLVSAPVPQGMAWPPGCVAWGGGVVFPVVSAIAKRVVHRVVLEAGDVNW